MSDLQAEGSVCWLPIKQRPEHKASGLSYDGATPTKKIYRGLGRSGRAVSERGLMRRRGPIGGGTACRELPQLGQNSSPALGPERYARNQCPRAEHS